jgi:RNA 2',3'-cyclic 3'-phosphodiesterase
VPTADTTRTFVAVFPPPDLAARVAGVLARLRQPGDGVSWVRAGNLHYTLRFLGDLAASQVEAAGRAAARAARGGAPFSLALGGPGAFPNARRPSVLWLGAESGGEALVALAAGLEAALTEEGFPRADRPFAPHLTLGRLRERANVAGVAERYLAAEFPGDAFEVGELVVVKSTLAPGGSRYEPLERAPLAVSADKQ